MANFWSNTAKHLIHSQQLNVATADLRAMLCMSNTDCDTKRDADNLSEYSDLDEYDGASYARVALANKAVARDDVGNLSKLTADPTTYSNIGAGTRQAVGSLTYLHVDGTAANDVPLYWHEDGGFPFDGQGLDFTITWHADGVANIAD